jgi:lipopolysaccharide/colanic/teichoic acid biosynthesis glycosyltransferase
MGGQLAADWEHRRVSIDSALKRLFDVVGAGLLLVVISPLLAGLAIAVKLESRGPVFYRCRRVGFRGRELHILKFRKMHKDATGPALTVSADERLTRVGRFVARAKLDELPQLWNVLKGEMSIVGPRPERPEFIEMIEATVPFWNRRLLVKPGITGWAQVRCGYASDCDAMETKLSYDLWYLRHRSLLVDFAVCVLMFFAVLRRPPRP